MKQSEIENRNFNTISPSAKWILLMKGHTNIPFAKRTAELIEYPEKFNADFENNNLSFWARILHFESRYWSIDQLLADLSIRNILELSSGFSFRGLDFVQRKEVYYIDTDLPDMIERKKEFVTALHTGDSDMKGKLELIPLNALDYNKFNEIINHFPPGEIVIVNEGLLVYLNTEEKEKLCGIIRKILKERGGYWITADIYIKFKNRNIDRGLDERTKKFLEDQQVEDNKFESLDAATEFFRKMGFVIDKEANIDPSRLSSFPYLIKNAKPEEMRKLKEVGKIHATWRLRLAA